jgi:uncharacterized protein (TIGR01777 family)
MKVAVGGSSGLIGHALVEALAREGHEVVRLVRREPQGAGEVRWQPGTPLDPAALAGVDAAVNLAGAGVGDKRWNDARKKVLVDSRVGSTQTLATALAALEPRPRVFVAGSAVGYYGADHGDTPLDESSPAGSDFLARLCVQWEAAAGPAANAGIRVVHPRTGVVLDKAGGAAGRMFPLFKLGLGGRLGSGRQYWSCISLEDEVRAILFALENDAVSGPLNLTAPEPATNAAVTRALGKALHRPTLVPAPSVALKLALGEFAGSVLGSGRVLPRKLLAAGFTFRHPDIDAIVRAALGRPAAATPAT